ncbi:uncharacterized protein TNCV_1773861 [Trichonephila clavipes]|nr:uncharacterized protein TNCV_1773861 [Trichonephila clavipes]
MIRGLSHDFRNTNHSANNHFTNWNRQENRWDTRVENKYHDTNRPQKKSNRFGGQCVGDSRRFESRRRSGQSDHRFNSRRQTGWFEERCFLGSRALALNSREQLIQEQREDPELGHIYRYLENPEDGSVNATVCEAVNESTGKTPAELFLGRKIITPFRKLVLVTDGAEYVGGNIEKLFDEARQNMQRQHKTWEKYYNRKKRVVNIKVNDLVLSVGSSKNNNLTIWKRGRNVTVNIDQVRINHPRNLEASSYDSINETTYEGKESSNWSNRSNSEKSRRSRKPSGNENKSCKSDKGNAGSES